MATFRTVVRSLGPRWLTEGEGELVLYSVALVADAFAQRAKLGLLARFPDSAPEDALPKIGHDRRIVRGIEESASSYAGRLRLWLDSWRGAGGAPALLRQLRGYLGAAPTLRTVDNTGNWTTLSTANALSWALRGTWDWDGLSARWWRFWTVVDSSAGPFSDDGTWDDPGTWDDGGTWDTTATPEQVETVRQLVRTWSPAHAVSQWIVVSLDGLHFDPLDVGPDDGTWGAWSKVGGGVQVPARHDGASYWDGV